MPRRRRRTYQSRNKPTPQLEAALEGFHDALEEHEQRLTGRAAWLANYRRRCQEAQLEAQRNAIRRSMSKQGPEVAERAARAITRYGLPATWRTTETRSK